MFRYVSKVQVLGLIAVLAIALVAACGSDSEADVSQSKGSTEQVAAAPEATVAPAATTAPEPTATTAPAPTATKTPPPTAVPFDTTGWVARELPEKLAVQGDGLEDEEIEALWTEFMSDARIATAKGEYVADICSDGSGKFLGQSSRSGEPFTYEIKLSAGGRWNAAKADLEFPGSGPSSLSASLTQIPLEITRNGEQVWGTYTKTLDVTVYDSPGCE